MDRQRRLQYPHCFFFLKKSRGGGVHFLLAYVITARSSMYYFYPNILGTHCSVNRIKQQEIKPLCKSLFDSRQHIVSGDFSGS